MADFETDAVDGKWYWYGLGPSDLSVHKPRDPAGGITLTWKGGVPPDTLKRFFEKLATQLSGREIQKVRIWAVNNDGPTVVETQNTELNDKFSLRTPQTALSEAEFIQFEALPAGPVSDNDAGRPILAVFSNQDQHAESLADAQQSVGVYVDDLSALDAIDEQIADMVVETRSPFFRTGPYTRAKALTGLHKAMADLRINRYTL